MMIVLFAANRSRPTIVVDVLLCFHILSIECCRNARDFIRRSKVSDSFAIL